VEREVREFFAAYAEDLRGHRREALANRYDPRGVFGRKRFRSFEENRNAYLARWEGPKSFEWRDLSVEVVSPDAAVVLALFEWRTDEDEALTYSYTGLLIRYPRGWRIRAEDESNQPAGPLAQ
jgi:ketosteroid isomerase-like protein